MRSMFLLLLVGCGGASSTTTATEDVRPDAASPVENMSVEDAGAEAAVDAAPGLTDAADAGCPGLTDPCSCRSQLDACRALDPVADCGFSPECQEAEPWYPVPVCGPGKSHRIGGREGCQVVGDKVCCKR